MAGKLSPLNDLNRYVLIEEVNSSGVVVPVTSGTVTGFLATTNASGATAADATLSASLTYVGGSNDIEAGTWLFQLDAAVLTLALLNTHFGSTGVAYLIVKKDNSVRRWERLEYVTSLPAEIG